MASAPRAARVAPAVSAARTQTAPATRALPLSSGSTVVTARPRVATVRTVVSRADAETSAATAPGASDSPSWVRLASPEDLPKGERLKRELNGEPVLLFWYRNEIMCIENRSPAEGAFSTGFSDARFTQDYGIVCPSTASVFSLKSGQVLDWYPSNPVLRALTPADSCRLLRRFAVKLEQDGLLVDPNSSDDGIAAGDGGFATAKARGGADTSLENNNVFSVEPRMYVEGEDPNGAVRWDDGASASSSGGATKAGDAATAIVSLLGVAVLSVAGTAFWIFEENLTGLAVFWVVMFAVVATYAWQTQLKNE